MGISVINRRLLPDTCINLLGCQWELKPIDLTVSTLTWPVCDMTHGMRYAETLGFLS